MIESYEHDMKISADKSLENIKKGDVLADFSRIQSISYENDKLSLVDDTRYSSLSCRVFENNRVGNAYTNDLKKFKNMVSSAQESAQFGAKSFLTLPEQISYTPISWMHNEMNLSYTKGDLKNFCDELLLGIKQFAPTAKVSVGAQTDYSFFYLHNTAGFIGSYKESFLSLTGGLFALGLDGSFLEMYEGFTFYDQEIDLLNILMPLEEKWERCNMQASLSKEGKMPVIFAPSVLELLIDPVEISVNAKTLEKGLSLFDGKIGHLVTSEQFSLYDDPHYLYGAATVPFDDEGVRGKRIPIIEKGSLKNFVYDCATASKRGVNSTGHGFRSNHSLPYPSMTNKIVETGDIALEDMIKSIDYGLFVESVLGEGQSNVIAGDFSVLGDMTYLIENGTLKGRVKDVMISGNAFDLLKNIVMLENKLHKESDLFAPHLLIDGVSVSYK